MNTPPSLGTAPHLGNASRLSKASHPVHIDSTSSPGTQQGVPTSSHRRPEFWLTIRRLVLALAASTLSAQPVDQAKVDQIVLQALTAWRVPGVAVAIVRQDQVVYLKGHGVRRLGQPDPVTPDSLFQIASTTKAFTTVIERCLSHPQGQVRFFQQMWAEMDKGVEFSTLLNDRIRRFNGEFFKTHTALPLHKTQLQLLADAAKADWTTVEPAIFGTLLERALDPATRHALGAHYTPRAYVERLVFPTVIQPLRDEWSSVKAAAAQLQSTGKEKDARAAVRAFHQRLADLRVLDPACGSGNFLYVTFEHLKRLEGEVVELREALGDTQQELDLATVRVHPSHFLGLELNPRAAALAELVLWIGYLQWQHRSGKFLPDDPVLSSTRSVQCADAVLAHDGIHFLTDENGQTVRRWDGHTYKTHPVTGENVPDESATAPVRQYTNPRPAPPWPDADYIVGNPPFIGNKRMRDALGDGYTEALRKCWPGVPETADFVMYWWHRAASLVCQGKVKRFGLITTNSITQTFNRRIVEAHLAGEECGPAVSAGPGAAETAAPLSLLFAIPDHPWVDSADGAAVRIAMTVGARNSDVSGGEGTLATVTSEKEGSEESEGVEVSLRECAGVINPDLTVGTDVTEAVSLKSNAGLCFQGMNLVGEGFRLNAAAIASVGYQPETLPPVIRRYQKGRPLLQGGDSGWVIDCFGLTADEVCTKYPSVYQWLLTRVKPERDHNNRASRKKNWWLFGEPVGKLRRALGGLSRYIVTVETSKFKPFVFIYGDVVPDHKLYAIACDDASILGVLSSVIHQVWALAAGGRLGVGNDPTWTNTSTFLPFPFPALAADSPLTARIRALGEQLDAHRKTRQAAHPGLTLTGMYNVLTKLRGGDPLTAKEKLIHEQGLVSVLQQLHDDLDHAVLEAYGWPDIAAAFAACQHGELVDPDTGSVTLLDATPEGFQAATEAHEELLRQIVLTRLAALNRTRAAEESTGHLRHLRPDFQNRSPGMASSLPGALTEQALPLPAPEAPVVPSAKPQKHPWPADLPAQATALRQLLASYPNGVTAAQLATHFQKAPKPTLTQLLETLTALGQATKEGETYRP